jgi:hypothetical protein
MSGFAAAEPHLHLYLVALLEEPPRGAHPHLQIVVVSSRPQPHLFHFRDVLILFGVSGSLVLLELELPHIGNPADRRIRRRRDFDQIQSGFFSPTDRLLEWHDTDLLSVGIDNAHLGNPNLTIGARASWRRWPCDEWWTRNRRAPNSTRMLSLKM